MQQNVQNSPNGLDKIVNQFTANKKKGAVLNPAIMTIETK